MAENNNNSNIPKPPSVPKNVLIHGLTSPPYTPPPMPPIAPPKPDAKK